MLKLILIGLPGSGKDTVGRILSRNLNIPLISLGELLRSSLKGKEKKKLDNGELISDEIIDRILKKRILKLDSFILNGFPRNLTQAEKLEQWGGVERVFFLDVSEKEVLRRLYSRFVCPECGFVSKKDGVCASCGSKLVKRKDDRPEVVKKRINLYKKETLPVVKFYKKNNKLVEIKGGSGDSIAEKIEKIITR
jgi:adenylate kinase